jgi:hypothetical protein
MAIYCIHPPEKQNEKNAGYWAMDCIGNIEGYDKKVRLLYVCPKCNRQIALDPIATANPK